jgi:DNA-binding NarL/FixJ family response regulator
MIHAIVADDEVLARQKLRQLLREEQDVEVVGECASASETIELVRSTRAELLFLDIKMPGMDGFDVIGALSSDRAVPMPAIVFTTAYDQYALRAFEVHAVDYLLKPFTRERLHSAIDRARQRAQALAPHSNASGDNGPDPTTRIVFKSRGRILFLPSLYRRGDPFAARNHVSSRGAARSAGIPARASLLHRESQLREGSSHRVRWRVRGRHGHRPKDRDESRLSITNS